MTRILESRCKVKYIEMTIEEALEYSKGDKSQTVLVAVMNLETEEIVPFTKKNIKECENIIKEAETIARVYDEFVSQLRVFTVKQMDIMCIEPHGKQSTILYKNKK